MILSLVTDTALHVWRVFPPWFQPMSTPLWLLATAYRALYSVLGAYIAARFAQDRPMLHALILGSIGTVLGIMGAASTWDKGPEYGPKWFSVGLIVIAIPCSWAGAKLARWRRQERRL